MTLVQRGPQLLVTACSTRSAASSYTWTASVHLQLAEASSLRDAPRGGDDVSARSTPGRATVQVNGSEARSPAEIAQVTRYAV